MLMRALEKRKEIGVEGFVEGCVLGGNPHYQLCNESERAKWFAR